MRANNHIFCIVELLQLNKSDGKNTTIDSINDEGFIELDPHSKTLSKNNPLGIE